MNGNWGFEGSPNGTGTVMDATLTTTGGKVAGAITLLNPTCPGTNYAVTGTLSSAGAATLTAQGLSITGTVANGVFNGTWTDAQCSPSGTTPRPLTGYPVASLVGTWQGAVVEGSTTYPMTATITSENAGSIVGAGLAGAVQLSNSPCLTSATISSLQSMVVGMSLSAALVNANSETQIFGTVAPGSNTINGTFSIVAGDFTSGGVCLGSTGTFYLNRN